MRADCKGGKFSGSVADYFADLVASGDERERQRLSYWLTRWASDPKVSVGSPHSRGNISSTQA
jgi:hypothetical protein